MRRRSMVRAESAARQSGSFKLVIYSGENKTSDIPCIELCQNPLQGSLRLPTITTSSALLELVGKLSTQVQFTYVLERELSLFSPGSIILFRSLSLLDWI